jgi:ABC-type branched-subunit amino acid transport system substrate-binding protein
MTHRLRPALFRIGASLAALLCAAALPACSSDSVSSDTDADSITVGLLLPFTGSSSATASNFERAVLYAADRVNAGGGVKGHRLRIVSRDTHSDLERSKTSVTELIDAGAVMVIGPESDEIAQEIIPILNAHQVGLLSPVVGAANDAAVDCSHPWVRLAPSARALGEALAKQVSAHDVNSVALMYAASNYDEALRDAVKSRFETLGGSVALELRLDPNAQSYAEQVEQARSANAEAIVLTSSPRAGALVVNEFDALSATPPRWFLSPLLKTDLLVQNVAPEALEGALGVAPSIHDTSTDFKIAFGKRWQGDVPLEGAYFYYDAVALLALAIQKTNLDASGALTLTALEAGLLSAAGPPGEGLGWNDIEDALGQLRNGENVYYSGLTGPLLLNACGERAIGSTTPWEVHAGSILDDAESSSSN